MDTGLFTGYQKMSDNWNHFRDFIASHRDVRVAMPIRGGCATELSDEVVAATKHPSPMSITRGRDQGLPADDPVTPRTPARPRVRPRPGT